MITNLYPKTDPRHAMVNEYFKHMNQCEAIYTSVQQTICTGIKELRGATRETSTELNLILNEVKQYNENTHTATDFTGILDKLTKEVEELQRDRDEILNLKREKKVAKSEMSARIDRLKAEMDELTLDNNSILAKFTDVDHLPLLCQLMKST